MVATLTDVGGAPLGLRTVFFTIGDPDQGHAIMLRRQ